MSVRLFWSAISGFIAGVFVASLIPLGWTAAGAVALIAISVWLIAALEPGKPESSTILILCAVFLFASAAGIARMHVADIPRNSELDRHIGEEVTLNGVVVAEPDVRENSVRVHVDVNDTEADILAIVPLHADIEYGDVVSVKGKLTLPETFETETGREFNYPAFLKKSGILYTLSFAQIEKMAVENVGNWFVRGTLSVKQEYLEGLQRALPEPSAGLAGGITVGDKRALGSELSDTFRTVALIHIVVLSGYNIMVVINALGYIFKWAPQTARFAIGSLTAIVFVIMTGAAAPSVRAAAMAMIGMAGRMTKRTYLAVRALATVAFLMVAWNPYALAFDPGFELSVAATWGIVVLTPHVLPYISRLANWPILQEIVATTIATQIAVLPLLLYQSGLLSLYALPANLLVLATLPAAMFFSMLASIAGLFFGPLASIIAFPAHILLSYFVWIADFLASLPLSTISIGTFNVVWLIAAYGGLLWYTWHNNAAKEKAEHYAPPI